MKKALVLLSGGIDSAAALSWSHRKYEALVALSFRFQQRPYREQLAVYRLLQSYPAKLLEVSLPFLGELSGPSHPEGYIPNRNMIYYSIAAYYADLNQCGSIVGGHTAEDSNPFADASASFLQELETLINKALLKHRIQIELPLIQMTKVDVLRKAVEWQVPLEHTWSCYQNGDVPCGKCVSCVERAEAFHALNLKDPLLSKFK
jgi:7-cyano-7-deazaguanine synthase